MRVLLTSVDWTGHFFPMVPQGWALQAAGHEVRVLCSTALAPAVERAGLTPVPLMAPTGVTQARMNNYLRARQGLPRAGNLPVLHPLTGAELGDLGEFDLEAFSRGAKAMHGRWLAGRIRQLKELAASWRPALVLHDLSSVDGRAVADYADVPAVAQLWGLVADAERDSGLDYRAEAVDPSFAEFGLSGTGAKLTHLLDPTPGSLAPVTEAGRIDVRFVPYNGNGAMPSGLTGDRRRPRITVVWGTSVTTIYGKGSFLVPKIVRALGGLPVDALLAVPAHDMTEVGELPPNVRLLTERAPLRLLLAESDLVIHNGAAGSVMTALAAGVPQLALSISDEQAGNGARVAAGGAGLQFNGVAADLTAIREAVTKLLDETAFTETAAKLRAENLARPTPAQVVPALEELALEKVSTQI